MRAKDASSPGFLADFVVLGDDPLAANAHALGAIPVQATYAGGCRVWAKERSP